MATVAALARRSVAALSEEIATIENMDFHASALRTRLSDLQRARSAA